MCGKGRIVSAAVLCVKHQGHIQYLCLQLRILSVFAQKTQNIFCGGQLRLGIADDQALIQMIMPVGMITVHTDQRELGNESQGLAEYIGDGDVLRLSS